MPRVRRSVWQLGNPESGTRMVCQSNCGDTPTAIPRSHELGFPGSGAWLQSEHAAMAIAGAAAETEFPGLGTLPAPNLVFRLLAPGLCRRLRSNCGEDHRRSRWAARGGRCPIEYYSDGSPNARRMPRAFVRRQLPDGSNNPLWSPRRPNFDSDPMYEIPAGIVDTGPALSIPVFTSGPTGVHQASAVRRPASCTLARPQAWPAASSSNKPHNLVHDAIGGWMGYPNTARARSNLLASPCQYRPALAGVGRAAWCWRQSEHAGVASNVAFTLYDSNGARCDVHLG